MLDLIIIVGCSLLVVYAYVLYPFLMRFWSTGHGSPWQQNALMRPSISVILAVYNEEDVIAQCLDALLQLDYSGTYEILVGSDGSSDGTGKLLRSYSSLHPHIKLFEFQTRRGKIPVVNDLVARAQSDLLFFTDADVTLDPHCLERHATHYADSSVGGVAGNLLLSGEEGIRAEPLGSEQYYMSVENRLRMDEAMLHSTVGIFGGHYSIRRTLWKQLPNKPICDELYIALNIIQSGNRMVFEHRAVAREYFGRTMVEEFQRKARFAARGLATLALFPSLLSPRSGWASIMLWSHKLFRWFAPFAIAVLLGTTVFALWHHTRQAWVIPLASLEALGLMVLAAGSLFSISKRPIPLLSHINWFAIMNVAFGIGVLRFFLRRERFFWTQTTRLSVTSPMKEAVISEEAIHS